MLGITDLPTYLAGLVLIVLLPGPNSLYVLSVAARGGTRTGYRAAAGVFTGDAVLMLLAAVGAASLLQTTPLLFTVVKYAGAAYLAWMAIGMLRSAHALWTSRHRWAEEQRAADAAVVSAGAAGPGIGGAERPFRRALVVSLFNPKVILFLISFFVQFVDPAYAYPALSFLVLGLLLQFVSLLYLSVLIFSGTRLAAAFGRRRRLSAGATSAVGALFLGFAVKLSVSSA
ncbi:leucine efflux protein [Nocardiopsis terrae]|uniref:Leucine efflux protein n=1 Tax=Nocardiopsis terrae TaxID=372655 RepID=A0ABR9HAX0_9ACTN|nr:leucine efflux protein LeuE [Nocardiopsis terrae]MBE1456168.1 leucine efflux protein [Nocardiopsis terrae]GHC97976.1 leucine efflux protein [Nocardiopsis terrae]